MQPRFLDFPPQSATMVDDYWTRLKAEMDKAGFDIAKLAKELGITYQAVNKVKNGGAFGSKNNLKAARLFGVSPEYLATGKAAEPDAPINGGDGITPAVQKVLDMLQSTHAQSNVEPAPTLKESRRVPVVGEVKGGDDGYLDELQYPVGHGDGYVDYPVTDPQAYALRVRGDSMYPRYKAGEFIVVEPSLEAQPGDDVVVSLKDGRKLLKELNWVRDGEVQLLSSNNHFGPMTIQLEDVLYIQLVSGRARRSSFHKT